MAKDPVITGCLAKLGKGEVASVGVLADYLEENSLPGAKKIRSWWDKFTKGERCWQNIEVVSHRRKYTRWQYIALWRSWLRLKVKVFYYKHPLYCKSINRWPKLKLNQYK